MKQSNQTFLQNLFGKFSSEKTTSGTIFHAGTRCRRDEKNDFRYGFRSAKTTFGTVKNDFRYGFLHRIRPNIRCKNDLWYGHIPRAVGNETNVKTTFGTYFDRNTTVAKTTFGTVKNDFRYGFDWSNRSIKATFGTV